MNVHWVHAKSSCADVCQDQLQGRVERDGEDVGAVAALGVAESVVAFNDIGMFELCEQGCAGREEAVCVCVCVCVCV